MMKRCKLCGGEPKWIYYCVPEEDSPYPWEATGDNGEVEPPMLYKRIECKSCGATIPQVVMTGGEAEIIWNAQQLIQKWSEGDASDVEPTEEEQRIASENLQKLLDPQKWK